MKLKLSENMKMKMCEDVDGNKRGSFASLKLLYVLQKEVHIHCIKQTLSLVPGSLMLLCRGVSNNVRVHGCLKSRIHV